MKRYPPIYFAAGLFNGPDCVFNEQLVAHLEKKGKVFVPQRDGFEFGKLHSTLSQHMPRDAVPQAIEDIIYSLDIGRFVSQSEVVVARFDEPLDPGVDIELACAFFSGKCVIGYRTDVRAPYGTLADTFGGAHFFPGKMCDVFVKSPWDGRGGNSEQIKGLAERIDRGIRAWDARETRYNPPNHRCLVGYEACAKVLFDGLEPVNSDASVKKVVERYLANTKGIREIYGPLVIE